MTRNEALAGLKTFGLFLAAEFSGAKRGEWRCPMIGAEAATDVVEAIAQLSADGQGPASHSIPAVPSSVEQAKDAADQAIARILAGQPDRHACLTFIGTIANDDGFCRTCGFVERCHEERAEVISILDALIAAVRAEYRRMSDPDMETRIGAATIIATHPETGLQLELMAVATARALIAAAEAHGEARGQQEIARLKCAALALMTRKEQAESQLAEQAITIQALQAELARLKAGA